MRNDRSAAQALDRYITAQQQRQSVAPVQNVDLADVIFIDDLLAQLEHDILDSAFVAALEARLVQRATTQQAYAPLRRQASHMYEHWRAWIGSRRPVQSHAGRRFMQRMSLRFAVMMIVVLSVVGVLPVAAQAILTYFAPREVTALPPPAYETVEARPTALRWVERPTLEQQAGFSVLAPNYLPPNCTLREQYFLAEPKVVNLTYGCMWIAEQRSTTVQQPLVGQGATRTVTVNGQPAVYIEGAWVTIVRDGKEEPLQWDPSALRQLVFERNGLLIRLSSPNLTLQELVQIAESMK